jgi:hypothetical protein
MIELNCCEEKMMIRQWFKVGAIATLISNFGLCLGVQALPGELPQDVAAWIESNPSFRYSTINNLQVTRFNTAAQKFTFTATQASPSQISSGNGNIIRSEKIYFFDVTNGVSFERLSEAMRTIYGVNVYQDFANGRQVYSYPDLVTLDRAQRENRPILAAQQGKLIEGDRFAYWIEIIESNPEQGFANQGHVVVLLKEDLPALENQLSNR